MTKIIAVTNNKGGVGKTHTVFHLSGAFAEQGKKVLAVDLDPQGDLSGLFFPQGVKPTLYDVLVDDLSINEAIHRRMQVCVSEQYLCWEITVGVR